jgi:MHS family proline/betaine transporter-like MFS transporter
MAYQDIEDNSKKKSNKFACVAGNIIEWYEFSIFIFLSKYIAPHFFGTNESYLTILYTFSAFAIGFLARPMGGIFFGLIGDIFSRKVSLIISVAMMTGATCIIGLIPSYTDIGIFSPILLITCRIIQGVSAGGEFTTSSIMLIESNFRSKYYAGSISYASAQTGLLVGSIVGFAFFTFLSYAQDSSSNLWRLPFIACLPLGFVTYQMRKKVLDHYSIDVKRLPIKDIFYQLVTKNLHGLIFVFIINAFAQIIFYSYFFCVVNWQVSGLYENSIFTSLMYNIINLGIIIALLPYFGKLYDQQDEKRRYMTISISMLMLVFLTSILFFSMSIENLIIKFIISAGYAVFIALLLAPLPTLYSSCFEKNVRSTAMSISFNLSAALIGGLAPIIITISSAKFGEILGPSMIIGFIGLASLITFFNYTKQDRIIKHHIYGNSNEKPEF